MPLQHCSHLWKTEPVLQAERALRLNIQTKRPGTNTLREFNPDVKHCDDAAVASCTEEILTYGADGKIVLTKGKKRPAPSSCTCLWGPLSICALAPSQAVLIASSDGVPSRSVIKSSCRYTTYKFEILDIY